MRKIIMAVLAALVIAAFAAVPAAATPTPNRGQPNQECGPDGSNVEPPGFTNSAGFANAEDHYAGSEGTPSAMNGNSHAVAQYDVACFQLSSH